MALNTYKCNHLTPLRFKGLILSSSSLPLLILISHSLAVVTEMPIRSGDACWLRQITTAGVPVARRGQLSCCCCCNLMTSTCCERNDSTRLVADGQPTIWHTDTFLLLKLLLLLLLSGRVAVVAQRPRL